MTQVKEGLKELSRPDTLPDSDEYFLKVERIEVTKKGTGEGAFCRVLKGPEDTANRVAYLYLLNYESGLAIGLSQLLKSLQMVEVPSGPHGKNDTKNLIGAEFAARLETYEDRDTKQERNRVVPLFDIDWWESVLADETPKKRSRKKATKR